MPVASQSPISNGIVVDLRVPNHLLSPKTRSEGAADTVGDANTRPTSSLQLRSSVDAEPPVDPIIGGH